MNLDDGNALTASSDRDFHTTFELHDLLELTLDNVVTSKNVDKCKHKLRGQIVLKDT